MLTKLQILNRAYIGAMLMTNTALNEWMDCKDDGLKAMKREHYLETHDEEDYILELIKEEEDRLNIHKKRS